MVGMGCMVLVTSIHENASVASQGCGIDTTGQVNTLSREYIRY